MKHETGLFSLHCSLTWAHVNPKTGVSTDKNIPSNNTDSNSKFPTQDFEERPWQVPSGVEERNSATDQAAIESDGTALEVGQKLHEPCVSIDEMNSIPLSWACPFLCEKTRIWEGGRRWQFSHLDACEKCGSRVASTPTEKNSLKTLIERHLL